MNCRSCGATLERTFIDLGKQPLANSYLSDPEASEDVYPLHARICDECLLVQCDPATSPGEIFTDYAFFSGMSAPWVTHCETYARQITEELRLHKDSQVIEIASNDGTLLSCFDGPRVLGIDPAKNVAAVAEARGIPTLTHFFTEEMAGDLPPADLVIANNVFGHVPDLNDFVAGLKRILKPHGTITVETPHLLSLIAECQYDTIYHEHFNYWSLKALEKLLARHGLAVRHVDTLDVHGGSLRLFVEHAGRTLGDQSVFAMRMTEHEAGLWVGASDTYSAFAERAEEASARLALWLSDRHDEGALVAGAGAPAKANTLLNAAYATTREIAYTTDTSPHKQGCWLPGSRIPVLHPSAHMERRPDFIVVLAWNWWDEITRGLADVGATFVNPRAL